MRLLKWLGLGEERYGFFALIAITGIIYFTFVHTVFQEDFHLANTPGGGNWGYGIIWQWLNPLFYTQPGFAYNVLVVQILALIPQLWLVKKKKLSKTLVYLNIFSSYLFRAGYSIQDVSTTVFAPLASLNPLFSLLLLFQKIGLGYSWNLSDTHWAETIQWSHVDPIVWAYPVVAFWLFYPPLLWLINKVARKQKDRFKAWALSKIPKFAKSPAQMTNREEIFYTIFFIIMASTIMWNVFGWLNSGIPMYCVYTHGWGITVVQATGACS